MVNPLNTSSEPKYLYYADINKLQNSNNDHYSELVWILSKLKIYNHVIDRDTEVLVIPIGPHFHQM